ncbi:MAG: hypothetical protein HY364_05330 [Candidatus Aenigmarchaeota archaeon]|nr:hypothetical protein [Candidatus Aenigmarchaeota archaeon]
MPIKNEERDKIVKDALASMIVGIAPAQVYANIVTDILAIYPTMSHHEVNEIAYDISQEVRIEFRVNQGKLRLAEEREGWTQSQIAGQGRVIRGQRAVENGPVAPAIRDYRYARQDVKNAVGASTDWWKRRKASALSFLGDESGAAQQLREAEQYRRRREIDDMIDVLRREIDDMKSQFSLQPVGGRDRETLKHDIDERLERIEKLNEEKSKYYYTPSGAMRAGARSLGRPLMGRVANASSGWNLNSEQAMHPLARSRVNKARQKLRKEGDEMFKELMEGAEKEIRREEESFEAAKKKYEKEKEAAAKFVVGTTGNHRSFLDNLAGHNDNEKFGALQGEVRANMKTSADRVYIENLREAFTEYQAARKSLEDFRKSAFTRDRTLYGLHLVEEKLNKIIGELLEENALGETDAAGNFHGIKAAEEMLHRERDILMFKYRARYRNKVMRGVANLRLFARNMAMGTMTWGDVWLTFWYNIRDFLFGPWIWGSLVVMLEWMLVGSYISQIAPSALYFVAPIGMGGLTLLLNIEGSMSRPWDWLTHFVSGMLIGFSAVIMAVAVITPEDMAGWDNREWFQFWFIWGGATMFIGIFSFYNTGGFLFVFQLSVLIMLFGWFALGPYRGVYAEIVDQIRAPILFVYNSFRDAFTDVWLLATNPQEYFARQQLKNVRAAQGVSLPDGVEIERIDLQPPNPALSEKGGVKQSFSASLEIRNKGKADARNVVAWVECDAFCTTATIGNIDYVGWLKDIKNADTRNPNTKISPELIAAAKAVSDNDPKQAEEFLKGSGLIEETVDSPGPFVRAGGATLKAAADVATEIIKSPQWIGASIDALKEIRDKGSMHAKSQAVGFKVRDAMRPSEAAVQTITNIGSHEISPDSKAYLLVSSLKAHVEYDYSASSTLAVKVASNEEYNQILREGLLENVVARGSPTTAQISLSVGRQPLKAGQQYDLVVSVINTRPDGHVYLDSTTPINISIPASMATSLSCLTLDGEYTPATPDTKEGAYKISYAPGANVDIKPSKFSSLFAFTCKFTTPATIDAVKTGLITAKLDTYRFRTTKDINVRYSPPVGVSGLLDKGVVIQDSVTTTLPSASSSPVVIG